MTNKPTRARGFQARAASKRVWFEPGAELEAKNRLGGLVLEPNAALLWLDAVAATEGIGTEHRVTSDRAHSWPELYLNGVGWVPFEPTPGVGRTPSYTQAEGSGAPTPEADPAAKGVYLARNLSAPR